MPAAAPRERRPQGEIRRDIASEREQLADALADLRESIDAKRRPAAMVGGALLAAAAAAAGLAIRSRLRG